MGCSSAKSGKLVIPFEILRIRLAKHYFSVLQDEAKWPLAKTIPMIQRYLAEWTANKTGPSYKWVLITPRSRHQLARAAGILGRFFVLQDTNHTSREKIAVRNYRQ